MTVWEISVGILVAITVFSPRTEAAPLCPLGYPVKTAHITTGIVYNGYAVSCPATKVDLPVAPNGQESNLHVATVDLTTPNLVVKASPSAANVPWLPSGSGAAYLLAPVTHLFPEQNSTPTAGVLVPQIGINANLFTNCCKTSEPAANARWTLVRGLEASAEPTPTHLHWPI